MVKEGVCVCVCKRVRERESKRESKQEREQARERERERERERKRERLMLASLVQQYMHDYTLLLMVIDDTFTHLPLGGTTAVMLTKTPLHVTETETKSQPITYQQHACSIRILNRLKALTGDINGSHLCCHFKA